MNVQFKFTQGTSTAPGTALTFKLKKMLTGETTWSDYQVNNVTATYSTDTNGLASIANLPAGQYQAAFSVDNTVATEEFNTIGTLVTDPATVSATQTTAASITGELYWDFEHNIIPAPNTKPNSGFSFSFNKPLGYSTDAVYQVTVYPSTAMTGGIYTVPSSTTFSTGTTIPAGTGLTSGNQYYYVVKFWKNGGSFGGGNYYGQTKPIPFTAP